MNARRVNAVVKRNWYEFRHSPALVFDIFYWPFFDLLAWGLLASFIERGNVDLPIPIAFLLGAALLWNVLYRVQNGIAYAFLNETWSDNVIGMLASPITPGEFVVGGMVWTGVLVVVQLGIMTALAWGVFSFGLFGLGLALVPFMAGLLLFAVAMSFFVLGMILRLGHEANSMAWGLAGLIQPFCAVYYPVNVLPGWAQAISNLMPPTHVFEGMRAVLAGAPTPWRALWASLILDAVYLAGSLWFARGMFERLRRRGHVTRYAT